MNKNDSLQRFLQVQETAFEPALLEIKQGRKRTHWMWYIFPQIEGLGFSETSKLYAIKNADEARLYLEHPLLHERLIAISRALLQQKTSNANEVFGSPDDMKLQSSMTLFAAVPGTDPVFQQVLDKFFAGRRDEKTLEILATHNKI